MFTRRIWVGTDTDPLSIFNRMALNWWESWADAENFFFFFVENSRVVELKYWAVLELEIRWRAGRVVWHEKCRGFDTELTSSITENTSDEDRQVSGRWSLPVTQLLSWLSVTHQWKWFSSMVMLAWATLRCSDDKCESRSVLKLRPTSLMMTALSAISSPFSSTKGSCPLLERNFNLWSTF